MGTCALAVVQLLVKHPPHPPTKMPALACLVGTTSRSSRPSARLPMWVVWINHGPHPPHFFVPSLHPQVWLIEDSKAPRACCCFLGDMDRRRRKQQKTSRCDSQEVSSIEWEYINMTEQEEDLIYRMYRLVGDRWTLIAGRIPGRTAQEIERFWIMRHNQDFAYKRKHCQG